VTDAAAAGHQAAAHSRAAAEESEAAAHSRAAAEESEAGAESGVAAEESGVAAELRAALSSLGVEFSAPHPGAFLVRLEGQHKLATMTWLIVGAHSLHIEAFFCRQPDENHAAFYRFLLERGGRMYGVHFALDPAGDVYLVGRLPLTSVTASEVDRLLGCVLSYSDDNFDQALMLGFASSIRREWAWRVKNGESLANLSAFARLTDPDPAPNGRAETSPLRT
jgi:hypothetical protein